MPLRVLNCWVAMLSGEMSVSSPNGGPLCRGQDWGQRVFFPGQVPCPSCGNVLVPFLLLCTSGYFLLVAASVWGHSLHRGCTERSAHPFPTLHPAVPAHSEGATKE